jgi:hypothetical protein
MLKPNPFITTNEERIRLDLARDAVIYKPTDLITGREWYDRFMYELSSDTSIPSHLYQLMSFKAQEATGLKPRRSRYEQ